MIKRPSAKDTEEDLLRFQEEFLANIGKKSGADAKKTVTTVDGTKIPEKPSASVYRKAQAARENRPLDNESGEENGNEEDNHNDPAWFPLSVHKDPHVLGDVVERPFDVKKLREIPLSASGFPQPEQLSMADMAKPSKGRSLFARQMLAKSQNFIESEQKPSETKIDNETGEAEAELKVDPKLMAEIDAENRKKLSKMSREQIEADRDELSNVLPPSMLHFLRNRKPAAKPISSELGPISDVKAGNDKNVATFPDDLPVKPDAKWLHMDNLESDKLEWTKDVPIGASAHKELRGFETRFDFQGEIAPIPNTLMGDKENERNDGILIPEPEMPPTSSGLYHHGDEPDRPGYTLSELLDLARSTQVQQRVLALRTLAAICRQARSGSYISAGLDKPIIPCLIEAGYGFVVRQALDDSSSEGNAIAALTALHDLICEPEDEFLLNCWSSMNPTLEQTGFPYMANMLISSPSSDEELKKLDDGKLMSLDVILCLVFRTNLIARLRYIYCDWPIPVDQEKIRALIVSVLLRIARHSPACSAQIGAGSSGKRLLTAIFEDSRIREVPLALTLLATLAKCAPNMASSLVDVNRLVDYALGKDLILATGSLEVMSAYCQGKVRSAGEICISLLGQRLVQWETVFLSKSDCIPDATSLNHLSVILQLFTKFGSENESEYSSFQNLAYGLLEPILVLFPDKFVNWLNADSKNSHVCLVLASAFHLAGATPKSLARMPISTKFQALLTRCLEASVSASLSHSTYSIILRTFDANNSLRQLNENSRALQYFSALKSSSIEETIPGHAVANWALLTALFQFCKGCQSVSSLAENPNLKSFLQSAISHQDIINYFRTIGEKKQPVGFANSFFHLNIEMGFICSYANAISTSTNADQLTKFFASLIKLLPLMPSLFSPLIWSTFFDDFLFNVAILNNLGDRSFSNGVSNSIQGVRSVYRDAINVLLNSSGQSDDEKSSSKYSFSQAALVKDWIYFPLAAAGITINTAQQVPTGTDTDQIMPALRHRVTVAVLRYVRFMLRLLPGVLLQELTPLTHFVRLSSLYLNDDVFGGAAGELEGVRGLLADCLTCVLKHSPRGSLNFTEKVPGLDSTLPDFYIALLEQFKASSYGDTVFGNILLLFAQASQPVVYRRLLWGDHREVLTFLRHLRFDQLLVEADSFLQPFETNLHMLKLYAEFIFGQLVNPTSQHRHDNSVIWRIAVNHLNSFLFDSSGRQSGEMLRKSMWQAAAQQSSDFSDIKKQNLKDLVFYKYTPTASENVSIYEVLPQNRLAFLRSVLGEAECRDFLLGLLSS